MLKQPPMQIIVFLYHVYIMTRKTRKNHGLKHNYTPLTAIHYFIKHASFSLFNNLGASGIIIKGTLHQNVESPYRMIRSHCFHFQVRNLLFKFFAVGGVTTDWKITTPESIQQETELQQLIYHKSFYDKNTLLEPICPSIVYSHPNALNSLIKQYFLELLENDKEFTLIKSMFSNDVGFIAMECMDNYKTLTSLKHSPKYKWYTMIAIYELSKLHELGYMHGDFHYDNVLIHETYNYFDTGKNGRAIIIDFGNCSEVSSNQTPHKLLEIELGRVPSNYMDIFAVLDIRHQNMQSIYIGEIERKLKHNIKEYIKKVILYKGGIIMQSNNNMSSPVLKLVSNPPKKHQWTFLSKDELDEIMSDMFASNFKNNPEAYQEFNRGIESFLQEEKKDPKYFERLMKAQTENLIVKRE